jgi:cobalt-zinc-cadmium efflux system outer membrane protein
MSFYVGFNQSLGLNMKTFQLGLLLGCLLLASTAQSQTDALTLDNAISTALAHNPELLAAQKRVDVAKGGAVQARLWNNPELELSAEDMPRDNMSLSHSKNLVGVSQTVPFPGKKSLDVRSAKQEARATESQFRASELELIRDVKTAFFRVLASERRLEISQQLVALADSLAKAARKRVEAGATAAQEQLRAEIELERAKTELSALFREKSEARQALATLMGRPEQRGASLAGTLNESPVFSALDHAREQLLHANPRLAVAIAERDRAELDLRRARVDPFPDVKLGVAVGRDESFNEDLIEFRVSLPLPLFDNGQGRRREALARAEIARAELTATEQRLLKEFVSAEARLRAAAEQATAYRDRILPKAEEALGMVQRGFEAGKFGFIDLLDTQRTAAEARLAYLEKLLELNSAEAELEAWSAGALEKTKGTKK